MKQWTVTDTCNNGQFTVLRRGPNSELPDINMGNEEDAYLAAAAPLLEKALTDLLHHFGKDGEFSICLKNGSKMGFGDAIIIGDKFQEAEIALKAAKNH